jgi:hypothetical protein
VGDHHPKETRWLVCTMSFTSCCFVFLSVVIIMEFLVMSEGWVCMCQSMNDFCSYRQTCSFYCGCKIRNNEVISLLIRHSVGTMSLCSAKCFCICFFLLGQAFSSSNCCVHFHHVQIKRICIHWLHLQG